MPIREGMPTAGQIVEADGILGRAHGSVEEVQMQLSRVVEQLSELDGLPEKIAELAPSVEQIGQTWMFLSDVLDSDVAAIKKCAQGALDDLDTIKSYRREADTNSRYQEALANA